MLIGFGALAFTTPQWFGKALSLICFLGGILSPFIIGSAMAFVLNIPMRFIEQKLLTPAFAHSKTQTQEA